MRDDTRFERICCRHRRIEIGEYSNTCPACGAAKSARSLLTHLTLQATKFGVGMGIVLVFLLYVAR